MTTTPPPDLAAWARVAREAAADNAARARAAVTNPLVKQSCAERAQNLEALATYLEGARPEGRRWQPINTAPLDGMAVLVCDIGCDTPAPWIAHWDDNRVWGEGPNWLVGYKYQWAHGRNRSPAEQRCTVSVLGCIPNATHWMPLPEPPK